MPYVVYAVRSAFLPTATFLVHFLNLPESTYGSHNYKYCRLQCGLFVGKDRTKCVEKSGVLPYT